MMKSALKCKGGFILVCTLSFVLFFFSWITVMLAMSHDFLETSKAMKVIEERLEFEGLLRDHFLNSSDSLETKGEYATYFASIEDKNITVRVVGATNDIYIYAIMEDESLVLINTEE